MTCFQEIKAVVMDIDGTLVGPEHVLYPSFEVITTEI